MNCIKKIIILLLAGSIGFFAFANGRKDASVQIVSGNLKCIFYNDSGSFCLYRLSEVGKDNWVPLYDDRALATTSSFSVLIGNKNYVLKKNLGKKPSIEATDKQIIVTYPLTKNIQAKQRFYFSTDKYETSASVLCIETAFENTLGIAVDVGMKALFDTNMGEKQRIPLYTDSQSITAETYIDVAASKATYLASANSISACVLFIRLEPQTTPSEVVIANWDYLQTRNWVPKVVEGRSFSTKYYNNDSAALFLWPSKRLNLNETYSVTQCIGYYDYLKRDVPQEAMAQHLQTLSETERKNYDEIQALLQQVEDVKKDPSKYSEDQILNLSGQVDEAILKLQ